MQYWYLDDFRSGVPVFAFFSYGIAVLGTPPISPSLSKHFLLLLSKSLDLPKIM